MEPGMALLQAALKQQQQPQPQGQQATFGARLEDAFTPKPDGLLMMLKGLMSQGANGPQLTPPQGGPAPSPLAGLQMPMGGFGAPMAMAPPMAMGGGFMPDFAGGGMW